MMQPKSCKDLKPDRQLNPETCPGEPCLSTLHLLQSIAEAVVCQKHRVQVTCHPDERGRTLVLTVAPEDLRNLVGGPAAMAESIRTIVQSVGMRHRQRFRLHIASAAEQPAG